MRDDTHGDPRTGSGTGVSGTGRIASLNEADDYKVADGEPDDRAVRERYDERATAIGGAASAADASTRRESELFRDAEFWGKRRTQNGPPYITRSDEERESGSATT